MGTLPVAAIIAAAELSKLKPGPQELRLKPSWQRLSAWELWAKQAELVAQGRHPAPLLEHCKNAAYRLPIHALQLRFLARKTSRRLWRWAVQ